MSVIAKIRWLRPIEGGRALPPTGPDYSSVARFDDQTDEQWLKEAWSLLLTFEGTPDENRTQLAHVRFLADESNAPVQWLEPQKRFALFEGRRKVAEGTVLSCSGREAHALHHHDAERRRS